MEREIPHDIQVQIGSQWWCLRRRTIEWILDFSKTRKDVMRFFRTTWIPDETFFQTLVRHLVPEEEIESRTLTFLMFSDYGMPVTFYDDHYDLLLSQDFLFARKISPGAHDLKRRLGDLYASAKEAFQISKEGVSMFRFLSGGGRPGRRVRPPDGSGNGEGHRRRQGTVRLQAEGVHHENRLAIVLGPKGHLELLDRAH